MKNLRIVFADDSPYIRAKVREALAEVPGLVAVGEAVNGAEAFWLYHQMRPDILILDLSMPSPSGLEVLHEIRKSDKETTIIVFTTDPIMMLKDAALVAGANFYFDKSDLSSLIKVCKMLQEQ
jgi:DNA-binding NarL/FixJ family response regulator